MQVDNCIRANKNIFALGYIEYLVARGAFQQAEVSFLPVGHTHEDTDQVFSRNWERLRSYDTLTLDDFHEELATVFNEHTNVRHMS